MTVARHGDPVARELYALADRIAWPTQPDLEVAVRERLASKEEASTGTGWLVARRTAILGALATLVLVATGVLVLSDAARNAVADWLGVGGVRIEFDDTPSDVGGSLSLGRRVGAEEAAATAAFPLRGPRLEGIGEPDEFYVDNRVPGAIVSLVYRPSDALPPAPHADAGMIVTEFEGEIDDAFFKKIVFENTEVHEVTVDGGTGLWLGGETHYLYRDLDGGPHEDVSRMAGNTLLWERDGITYRLESALGESAGLAIAESFGDL
ncbi:MAG: hypothetical protein QOH90_1442 [Actinomycetota bacterium]|nr:hypothetical protein [Actinomycetota bacterium]